MRYWATVTFRTVLLSIVLFTAVACHTSQSRSVSGRAAPKSDRRVQTSARLQKEQSSSSKKLALTARVALSGRVVKPNAVAIVVSNHDSTEVKLDGRLEVERYTNKGWETFGTQDVTLRYSCDTKVENCVALLPGAQLFVPPWQATRGPSQCRTQVGAPAPQGLYRFIASSCDQTSIVIGEPFQLTSIKIVRDRVIGTN